MMGGGGEEKGELGREDQGDLGREDQGNRAEVGRNWPLLTLLGWAGRGG